MSYHDHKHEWHDNASSGDGPFRDDQHDTYSTSYPAATQGSTASFTPSFSNTNASSADMHRMDSFQRNQQQSHEEQEQYPVGRPLSYFPTHHQPLSQQEYDDELLHQNNSQPLQHAQSPLSSSTPEWSGGGYSGYHPATTDIPMVGIDIISSNLEATKNGSQYSDTRTAVNMAGPSHFPPQSHGMNDVDSVYSSGAGVGAGVSASNAQHDKNGYDPNIYNNGQHGQAQQPQQPHQSYGGTVQDPEHGGEPTPKGLLDPKVERQLNKRKVWKPWFVWIVSAIQIAVLAFEFVKGYQRTNQIIQTNPLNPMIGPGPGTIIAVGARFVPCMRDTYLTNATIECPDQPTTACTLSDICGFTPIASTGKPPNQWFRFITPIFLHGGIVHLLFNLMFQLRTGADLERDMGWWRFGIIYMTSGIVGFIFGGNFAPMLSPSMGASGSIFGLIGCLLLDLFQNWKLVVRPCWELTKLSIMILISFGFGLLPFLDNFAHIGGFVAGILTGLVFMPVVYFSKRDKFIKLGLRFVALPLVTLIIILGLNNFYKGANNCSWCKYLSCLPINGWCDAFNPPPGSPGSGTGGN
ncbi:hypothetical protein BGZ51_000307 [Haplosporangium sp. Z 767]|nr:hypothetical protein BGZ50_007952 [Haplosporangium sp. Z 11]KAF9188849.1 hypothetical protein BGZ51_000307 [Haplosporangium sp. Z 767]